MELADKAARVGNFIIDSVCFAFLYILCAVAFNMMEVNSREAVITENLLFFIVYFIYYFSFEYFLGKTPGKYLTGTKVVDRTGKKPGVITVLIRSICRLISIDIFSYVFGQGFHDSVSGSFVVMDK